MYTAQNKYVCTRLFACLDGLNWSLNKKVYIILKLVQFPIQRWVKLFFVAVMSNVTASHRPYPTIISKVAKSDLLKMIT